MTFSLEILEEWQTLLVVSVKCRFDGSIDIVQRKNEFFAILWDEKKIADDSTESIILFLWGRKPWKTVSLVWKNWCLNNFVYIVNDVSICPCKNIIERGISFTLFHNQIRKPLKVIQKSVLSSLRRNVINYWEKSFQLALFKIQFYPKIRVILRTFLETYFYFILFQIFPAMYSTFLFCLINLNQRVSISSRKESSLLWNLCTEIKSWIRENIILHANEAYVKQFFFLLLPFSRATICYLHLLSRDLHDTVTMHIFFKNSSRGSQISHARKKRRGNN